MSDRHEPEAEPEAPPQTAPEAGAPPHRGPAMSAPGESAAEPERPAAAPEPAQEAPEPAETDETLALPPATSSDEPGPSQPERSSALEGTPVPFAAPPTERNGSRFATALTLGIVGGVAIVGAVVVALIVSLVTLTESLMDKIETTAEDFMADVSAERWDEAYEHLCTDLQERPVQDYVEEWEDWAADDAEVQDVRDEMSGTYVPVELGDGSTVELEIEIAQGETVDTTVCGWDHSGG
ncbi:hypothetical protein [Glycomyces tarimensis]